MDDSDEDDDGDEDEREGDHGNHASGAAPAGGKPGAAATAASGNPQQAASIASGASGVDDAADMHAPFKGTGRTSTEVAKSPAGFLAANQAAAALQHSGTDLSAASGDGMVRVKSDAQLLHGRAWQDAALVPRLKSISI